MKKLILLLVALSTSVSFARAQSQFANVKWGPEIKKESKRGSKICGGFDNTGYYLFSTTYTGLFKIHYALQKLDPNLNLVASEEYEAPSISAKMYSTILQLNLVGNRLFAFIYETDVDAGRITLYGQEINKTTLKRSGKQVKLGEMDYASFVKRSKAAVYANSTSSNNTDFMVDISKDQSKVFIARVPFSMEGNGKYGVRVCDASLNALWEKEFEQPYDGRFFDIEECKCDNDGNVAMLGKLYNDKTKDSKKGEQNFTYHIISHPNKGADKVDYEIKSGAGYIRDVDFGFNDVHNIVAAGFYSKSAGTSVEVKNHALNSYKKVGPASIDGTFYMTLDPLTKNVKVSTVKEFSLDFITQTMTEKEEKKAHSKEEKGKDQELMHYSLNDFVFRNDGGVVLVAEQHYTELVPSGPIWVPGSYHYDNLVVASIDQHGETELTQLIPKMQMSEENPTGYYSSYSLMVNGGNLHFIFNDNKDNLEAGAEPGVIRSIKLDKDKGAVAIATIDSKGKLRREEFLRKDDLEVTVLPSTFTQIGDSKMLITGNRKKNEQFAIVNFK